MYPTKSNLRKSGLIFSLGILLIFFIAPFALKGAFNKYSIFISVAIGLVSLLYPYSLRRPLSYWIKFGNILGKLNSYLILGIFFYIILLPFGLIRKMIKSIIMKKHPSTFYSTKNLTTKINFEDQF